MMQCCCKFVHCINCTLQCRIVKGFYNYISYWYNHQVYTKFSNVSGVTGMSVSTGVRVPSCVITVGSQLVSQGLEYISYSPSGIRVGSYRFWPCIAFASSSHASTAMQTGICQSHRGVMEWMVGWEGPFWVYGLHWGFLGSFWGHALTDGIQNKWIIFPVPGHTLPGPAQLGPSTTHIWLQVWIISHRPREACQKDASFDSPNTREWRQKLRKRRSTRELLSPSTRGQSQVERQLSPSHLLSRGTIILDRSPVPEEERQRLQNSQSVCSIPCGYGH